MKLSSVVFSVSCFLCSFAHASVLDVSDFKMLQMAREQLQGIKKQINKLDEERRVLDETKAMMQGHYKYSNIYNNPRLKDWQHSGKDWGGLLEGENTGALSTLLKQMEKELPIKPATEVYGEGRTDGAKLYDLLAKISLANRASNTLTYNNIDNELIMLEKLQAEIEKSPNQKAVLDLIARIQVEQAKLTAYQIKSAAVNGQLMGLQGQKEVSDAKWVNDFLRRP